MDDKEFLDKALGLAAPRFVRSVRLDLKERKVELEIESQQGGDGRTVRVKRPNGSSASGGTGI